MSAPKENSLADKLFPVMKDEDVSESILSIPPEQRRLHTETYDFTISTILDYLHKGSMFIPEFQRRYVWNQAQASRLIESLIIQCPIPVIYLSQEKDERLSVIDGNQRLQSLDRYISNQFVLKGLTAYPELEGFNFFQLDSRFQRHILNRTLRCIVIMKDTHPQVKFDVFERLNSGAVKLTAQELRHGIYHGKFIQLVEKLARNSRLRELLDIPTDKRMKTEELVIRFLALHVDLKNYRKPLSQFLNDFAEKNRDLDEGLSKSYTNVFNTTIDGITKVYGDIAFKVFDTNLRPISKFNAALFDAEMLSISLSEKPITTMDASRKREFIHSLATMFEWEPFQKTITRSTSDEQQLRKRVSLSAELVQKYL